MNIYAPATSSDDRYVFFSQLLQQPYFQTMITTMNSEEGIHHNLLSNVPIAPSIVLGDFNYNFRHYRLLPIIDTSNIQSQWLFHSLLTHYYREGTHELSLEPLVPTFRRSSTFSTIDYMFMDPQLVDFRTDHFVHFVHTEWTDHALLSIQFTFANPDLGQGLWRASPQLAQNAYFRQRLFSQLDAYRSHLASNSNDLTPQVIWDQIIKELARQAAKSCSRRQSEWRRRLLRRLQRKRNKLLRNYKENRLRNDRLPKIESIICKLQRELVDLQALRSGIKWREHGEQSAGFLKRLTSQRSQQRAIPTLQHPSSSSLCASTTDKQAAAVAFYTGLYTADAVNNVAINFFISQIPESAKIPDTDHTALCTPFATDELLDAAARAAPKQSSPGVDSLPYAILQLLFTHAATSSTAVRVYSDALLKGIFPTS